MGIIPLFLVAGWYGRPMMEMDDTVQVFTELHFVVCGN